MIKIKQKSVLTSSRDFYLKTKYLQIIKAKLHLLYKHFFPYIKTKCINFVCFFIWQIKVTIFNIYCQKQSKISWTYSNTLQRIRNL